MCGITGLFYFSAAQRAEEARALVKRMSDIQAHRGPDAEGVWSSDDGHCHLGHRRLSIIDLSDAANQPMLDSTGRYSIVFNGEIYNFRQLRANLESQGIKFKTSSDTEVLLQSFILHGAQVFSTLDGMFAVAIYDTLTRTLTLARDAAGESPCTI